MAEEREFIRFYIIDTASLQTGKITRIDHDTIMTKNGIMMMKDISRIDLGHSGKPRFNVRRSWIHLLPDSAYQSTESKHRAMAKIHQSIHKRRAIFRTDSVHSNFIKLNLARLFGLEIAFSYERKISRKISLELELGYGFPIYVHTPPGNGNPFEAFPYFPSEGYSIYIGPKFYNLSAPNSHGFYFEPFFMFKNLKAIDIYFPSNSDTYKHGDRYTLVYGLSLRIGTVRKYGGVVVDYYAGLGVKFKDNTYYCKSYWNGYQHIYYFKDHTALVSKELIVLPSVSLGIKMGFGF